MGEKASFCVVVSPSRLRVSNCPFQVKRIDRGEIKDYQGWVSRTRRGCDARNRRYNEKMISAAVRVSICWRAAVVVRL